MADLLPLSDMAMYVQKAAPHAHAAVAAAKPAVAAVAAPITQGVNMIETIIASALSALVAAIAGYFVGRRGLPGFQSDMQNAVTTMQKAIDELKAKVETAKTA